MSAVEIRREWQVHGLSTQPADRIAAEHSLARIYARLSRTRPRFVWVPSPHSALPLVAGLPTHDDLQTWAWGKRPPGRPPLASDIATSSHVLRSALDECLTDPYLNPPPSAGKKSSRGEKRVTQDDLPPLEAIESGVPLRAVLHRGVWRALRASLAGVYLPVRAALATGGPLPIAWYGQQDSSWIAYYDVMRRLGLGRFRTADNEHLDDWASLARSCGWWWPGEELCVAVERPAIVRTEPVPGGSYDEVRLRDNGPPPVEYRDGWRPIAGRQSVEPGGAYRSGQNPGAAPPGMVHTRPGITEVAS